MLKLFRMPAGFILFIVLLLFVIPMKLNGIKVATPVVSMAFLFPCALFFYLFKPKMADNEFLFHISFSIAMIFCLVIFFRQGDSYPLQLMGMGCILFFSAIALVKLYFFVYRDDFARKILFHLIAVGFINASVSLMTLINDGVADVIYNIVSIADNASVHLSQGYRSSGLFYSGASSLSVFNAVLFFIGLLLFFKIKSKCSYIYIMLSSLIVLPIIILATFVAGRLGLMFILSLLFYFAVFRTALIDRYRFISFLLLGAIISCFTLLYYVDYQKLDKIVNWSLELFVNYMDSGEVASSSSNILFEKMYFLPDSLSDILLGTGSFGRGDSVRYIDSDVGYVLMIFFGGVISLPIFILPYFMSIKVAFQSGVSPIIRYCIYWIVFCIFISNFKDVYLFGLNGVSQVLFLFSAIAIIQSDISKSTCKQ